MIEIKIEAASGAEARAELLALLTGGELSVKTEFKQTKEEFEQKIHETAVALKENYEDTQRLEATREKGKRRTKAEIAADEAAKAQEETPVDNEPDTSQAPPGPVDAEQAALDAEALKKGEEAKEVPTLQDLQRECAILVRAGYKEDGVKFIKTIGGAENSKEVPDEKRAAVIEAMAAFIEENKIAR